MGSMRAVDWSSDWSGKSSGKTTFTRRQLRLVQGISLWLAVILFFVLQSVAAQASERGADEPGAGELRMTTPDGQFKTATLLRTDYRVRVSGLLADTRLRQDFQNTSTDWREGTYVFPLPEKASLYAMQLRIGERVIVGEIKTRDDARKTYEKAKTEGKQAAHVEQQRPNLFTTRVANIPPGETVSVELRYQQAVDYQSGEFELRLPTTMTPRYMPGTPIDDPERPVTWRQGWAVPTTEVADADAISPFTVNSQDVPAGSHRAHVELTLNAGLPIANVVSPTHALKPEWQGEQVTVVPQSGDIAMDRDLVVRWTPKRGQAPAAAVFHERWQDEDYLLTLLVPGLNGGQSVPREMIFVMDTSGSMAGESIRQARSALLAGLDTLKSGDRFNIIEFNSETHALFGQAQPADTAYLNQARQYARGLQANGGTEMAPALDRALRIRKSSDEASTKRVRQVVFITDGAVGNERALYQQIQDQLGHSRLFTVGIGSAPNMYFMREAARIGRGTFTSVSDINEVASQLGTLFSKMAAPVLVDIQTYWPDDEAAGEAFPAKPGDLFRGEPLIMVTRGIAPAGDLELTGVLPDGSSWQQSLPLSGAAPGQGLHRYWARQKIDEITDQRLHGVSEDQIREQVTPLALAHSLTTPYTSFVAVDKTPVRPAGESLKKDAVPSLLPAGSSQKMIRYPQTATPSLALIVIGLAGLMPAFAVLMLRRRRVA